MKKIVIINGSTRKKNTYKALVNIAELLKDFEVEIINIKDYNISHCVGCENCLWHGTCNIKDEADLVLNKIKEADGIVIGTPVYLRQISGYLKTLIDRGCSWYHRSPLNGKPILFLTSTQATGSKQTAKYLEDLSVQWGTIHTGTISKTAFNSDKPILQKEVKKFIKYLSSENLKKYRPTFKQIYEFNTQKVLAVNIIEKDLEYWTEKGYINAPYFYNCKINPFYRFVGFLYYKMLTMIIVKNINK